MQLASSTPFVQQANNYSGRWVWACT